MKSKLKNLVSRFPRCKKTIVFVFLFICVERFCYFQTDGFRLYEIHSCGSHDPERDSLPLSEAQMFFVKQILNQPFHYLGGGGQCYAFESQDGLWVLKFFRHDDLRPETILKKIAVPRFLEPMRRAILNLRGCSLQRCRIGAKIALDELPEETAMLYIHLNKTKDLFWPLTITDKIGVVNQIDLDQTEFTLQKKAEGIFSKIDREIHAGNTASAKRCIDAFFDTIFTCAQKGIVDTDPAISRNFGFIGDKGILMDTGSLVKEESIKEPSHLKRDITLKSRRLHRWLRKHHPEFLPHFEQKLQSIIDPGEECLIPGTTPPLP